MVLKRCFLRDFLCFSHVLFYFLHLFLHFLLFSDKMPTDSDSDEDFGPTPSKKKTYDLDFKLKVVNYSEAHNKSKAAKTFKVSRQNV